MSQINSLRHSSDKCSEDIKQFRLEALEKHRMKLDLIHLYYILVNK